MRGTLKEFPVVLADFEEAIAMEEPDPAEYGV